MKRIHFRILIHYDALRRVTAYRHDLRSASRPPVAANERPPCAIMISLALGDIPCVAVWIGDVYLSKAIEWRLGLCTKGVGAGYPECRAGQDR